MAKPAQMMANAGMAKAIWFIPNLTPMHIGASTGGQVAYFKKIYFFQFPLFYPFFLMFNYEPSLLRQPDIAPLL